MAPRVSQPGQSRAVETRFADREHLFEIFGQVMRGRSAKAGLPGDLLKGLSADEVGPQLVRRDQNAMADHRQRPLFQEPTQEAAHRGGIVFDRTVDRFFPFLQVGSRVVHFEDLFGVDHRGAPLRRRWSGKKKRKAVEIALREFGNLSDRQIAELCGLGIAALALIAVR